MSKVKRAYLNDYPSVTTILGVLRKIGLENWFKYHTAQFCDAASSKGKLIGTQIHEGIENYIATGGLKVDTEYPDEVTNALKSFVLFRNDHKDIELQWSELMLTSEKHKFNGTLDCVAKIGEIPIILDWKTGECKKKDQPSIYEEYKYQTAAYVMAYNEVNNANIGDALVVSFAKDRIAYAMHRMGRDEIESHFFQAFIPALTIYNHQRKEKANGL